MKSLLAIGLLFAASAYGADSYQPDPDAGFGADASQNDDDKGPAASKIDWFSDMGLATPGLDGSSEGVNQNPYDRYGGAGYVLYDTAAGKRQAPSPLLNFAPQNYHYTQKNDSLAEGGDGDTLYQYTVTAFEATSETVRTGVDAYGNAVTNQNTGRNFATRVENTARRTARRFRKLF